MRFSFVPVFNVSAIVESTQARTQTFEKGVRI